MALRYGPWEAAEALVGKVIAEQQGADPVNSAMVRHLLESLEWDFAPALDAAAARSVGYAGAVAPRSSYLTFAMPAYWQPGDEPLQEGTIAPFPFGEVPCPGSGIMATGTSVEFHAPLLHGDVVQSIWVLKSLVRKTLTIGDGAFLEFEITYRNQRGAVIAVESTTVFRYQPEAD
ncbi:hypothetical protein JHV675_15070 [Mycobacterium avium subsp. hominissuis]